MNLWAIIPVKPFDQGKARLSEFFSVTEREKINKRMLINTIDNLLLVEAISKILIVTQQESIESLFIDKKIIFLPDCGEPELNCALTKASIFAQLAGAEAVIIIPSDLPLIDSIRIREAIKKAPETTGAVIVPDRHEQGTNLLFVKPVDLLPFSYGKDSFIIHSNLIRKKSNELVIKKDDKLEIDLDTPEDLDYINKNYGESIIQSLLIDL